MKKRNAKKSEEKPPEPVLKPGSEQLKKIHQSLRWHPLDPGGAGGVPYVFNLYFHLVSGEVRIGTGARLIFVSYLSSCAFRGGLRSVGGKQRNSIPPEHFFHLHANEDSGQMHLVVGVKQLFPPQNTPAYDERFALKSVT